MRRPVVHLYTVCWDEADMLGFFFRHYDEWVDRYVVYDDGSTDGSRDILRAHPRVELRDFVRVDAGSFVLSHTAMQDQVWKESRGRADWIVVTAIDEHLHAGGRAMADYLAEQTERGVTLIPALGFEMVSEALPGDRGRLTDTLTRGRPHAGFNKLGIFKPEALRETGFTAGRHAARPIGDLWLPPRDQVVLWHYRYIGFERNLARARAQAARLGTSDITNQLGVHYLWSGQQLRAYWEEMERQAIDLAVPGNVADQVCARPLWWEDAALPRVPATDLGPLPPALASPTPTVSVVICARDDAADLRPSIQSVLDQSFEDVEIVVSNAGATDRTEALTDLCSDPRLRVETLSGTPGISAARNHAIARARGRYIAILDAGDRALPGRLRTQVAFLDAHPAASLVAGLPRAVDDEGLPIPIPPAFAVPLTFPDAGRHTWLRAFFFDGDCLPASTVMVRREAYEAAGRYDPRLASLHDLDMWIRMLVAGHDIHLVRTPVAAVRFGADRADDQHPDGRQALRRVHERVRVLERFADLGGDVLRQVFAAESQAFAGRGWSVARQVAEVARLVDRIEHRHVALDLLFRMARSPEDLAAARDWGGDLDAFNLRAIAARDRQLELLQRAHASLDQALAGMGHAMREREATIDELRGRIAEADALLQRMRQSRSWRVTAPLRWLGGVVRRVT